MISRRYILFVNFGSVVDLKLDLPFELFTTPVF